VPGCSPSVGMSTNAKSCSSCLHSSAGTRCVQLLWLRVMSQWLHCAGITIMAGMRPAPGAELLHSAATCCGWLMTTAMQSGELVATCAEDSSSLVCSSASLLAAHSPWAWSQKSIEKQRRL
jgi:hypothetical protein